MSDVTDTAASLGRAAAAMDRATQVAPAASALRTPHEEFVGAATHGFGLLLSLIGGWVLVSRAVATGDALCVAGCAFYSSSLTAVYAASMLSHLYCFPEHVNRLFRRLDQGFIYLLIVGTYTPIAFAFLRTPGWMVFWGALMLAACGGFLSKIVYSHRLDGISIWLYLGIGWAQAIGIVPMWHSIPAPVVGWVVAGGLCYTLGTVFLIVDNRRYHFHGIWHMLVIAGSACHYVAILRFVVGGQ